MNWKVLMACNFNSHIKVADTTGSSVHSKCAGIISEMVQYRYIAISDHQ